MDGRRRGHDQRAGAAMRGGGEQRPGDRAADRTAEGVICGHCEQELPVAASCTPGTLVIGGRRYARRRGKVVGPDGRCGDCGILDGGVHHLGCDLERCPRCRGQLISCGCLDGGFRLEGSGGA